MTEPRYSTTMVCQATGATFRQVDFWIRKGYVRMGGPFPGSGQQRNFTFEEALQVSVLAEVSRAGVELHMVPVAQILEHGGFGTTNVHIRVDVADLRAFLTNLLDPPIDLEVTS